MILAPDGKALADRVTQPMTAEQLAWFLDPIAFLQGVPHLWTLKLRLYCQRCWSKGLNDGVHVTFHESDGTFSCRCECNKVAGRLPMQAVIAAASSTDELLRKLGWSLSCSGRCASERGIADGVEALNDPQALTLTIKCGCTERRFGMAA